MKNIAMATVILLASILSFAGIERTQISRVCLGEFSSNIVESVKTCSAKDLAEAQVEIYRLADEVVNLNRQILEAEAYLKGPDYANQKMKSRIIVTSAVGGVILGISMMGIGTVINSTDLTHGGYSISFLMLLVLAYQSAKFGQVEVSYEPKDVPVMKSKVQGILEQVKLRKSLLDAANAIKAAQITSAGN